MQVGLKMQKCANISYLVSVDFGGYLYKRSSFLLGIWASQGAAMLVSLLTNEEQKRAGSRYIWYYRDFVHDVTDTDCWAQNGNVHGHIFTTFKKCQFLANRTRNEVENGCKSNFYSSPSNRTFTASFLWFSFNLFLNNTALSCEESTGMFDIAPLWFWF